MEQEGDSRHVCDLAHNVAGCFPVTKGCGSLRMLATVLLSLVTIPLIQPS
jgi:hypothetical protein